MNEHEQHSHLPLASKNKKTAADKGFFQPSPDGSRSAIHGPNVGDVYDPALLYAAEDHVYPGNGPWRASNLRCPSCNAAINHNGSCRGCHGKAR